VIRGGTPLTDATAVAQWRTARRLVERGARTNYFADARLRLTDKLHDCFDWADESAQVEVGEAFWAACRR
jgi:uncharacterized protein